MQGEKIEDGRSGAEEWSPHDGGGCPVSPDATVRFRLRSGHEDVWEARKLNWIYGTTIWEMEGYPPMPSDFEIIAYKLETQS